MTTTKLTRTQRELLERAARKGRGRVSVHRWTCGKKCGGHRELSAMIKLVGMGLLTDYSSHSHYGFGYGQSAWNHPHTTYSTEGAATITEAGREAIR